MSYWLFFSLFIRKDETEDIELKEDTGQIFLSIVEVRSQLRKVWEKEKDVIGEVSKFNVYNKNSNLTRYSKYWWILSDFYIKLYYIVYNIIIYIKQIIDSLYSVIIFACIL